MKHLHASAGKERVDGAPATHGRLIHSARWYDTFVRLLVLGRGGGFRGKTVELAHIGRGDRVLDVGCGTGDLALAAKARTGPQGEVVGIDASPEMIEVARRKATRKSADVRFEIGLIEQIPFPNDHFDVVLSSLMLHHLPGELKQEGLVDVYRVLRPGGRVLVVDFGERPSGPHMALAALLGHGRSERRAGDLPKLLKYAGFVNVVGGATARGLLEYATGLTRS